MPHLASFRKGWESENIARYILHRFSFISHPATIADDIGSDFFCTLFHTVEDGSRKYLLPKNAFAIQVKSHPGTFEVTDKAEYLNQLEVPFLVGVVNRKDLELSIYSGEYIPSFFSFKGQPKSLEIAPCERDEIQSLDDYIVDAASDEYLLRFPLIVRINAHDRRDALRSKVGLLSARVSLIYENIVSKQKHEYIFRENIGDEVLIAFYAGPGSYQVYRNNLVERLAEAFVNLKWQLTQSPEKFIPEEFSIYEEFYLRLQDLEKYYGELPEYLEDHYQEVAQNIP